jgi:hypothetical protein
MKNFNYLDPEDEDELYAPRKRTYVKKMKDHEKSKESKKKRTFKKGNQKGTESYN